MELINKHKIYTTSSLPKKENYEVAIIGRSNVGKSSFINSLLQSKVARVSNTPGCTYWLGCYLCRVKRGLLYLVDLPGYGFFKGSHSRQNYVHNLVIQYFKTMRINEVWLLIDSRRGILQIDQNIIDILERHNIKYKIIATKTDKKGSNFEGDFSVSTKKLPMLDKIYKYLNNTIDNFITNHDS